MQKGRDAPQRQGGGHLTEASGDSGLCCLAIRCLLALRGLWVKDLPTGLQSYILSPDQPPAFAASNSLTLKLRHWVMDGKWGKGQKPFIFHQCPALLHTSLARKDKKEAGQAIPSFVYLNNDACHEKYAESHSKGSSMPGAKKEPSPGQREQACPRESNSYSLFPTYQDSRDKGASEYHTFPDLPGGMEEFPRLIPHKIKLTLGFKGP